MAHAPIIAVLDGSPASFEAVRWAAWRSQETGGALEVVHVYPEETTPGEDARLRSVHESYERARATGWLQQALDESAALPQHLRLVVAPGSLEDVVGPRLHPDGLLVLGSHGPASLVSWCSRTKHCPVVLVPAVEPGLAEASV